MKLDKLNIIIGRIKKDIFCPKCKTSFHEKAVNIYSIKENSVELCFDCSHCAEKATILATIEERSRHITHTSLPKKLSPSLIPKLSKKLKSLNDVKDLFND